MIDTKGELIRILEFMDKNMPRQTWMGVLLNGGIQVIAYSVN